MEQHNILIALPTYRDEVHIHFTFALVDTTRALSQAGIQYQMMHIGSSHIMRARNVFANYFLEHPEFTHLLFLDTDMHFSADAVTKLLGASRNIAGVAYPYRHIDLARNIEESDRGLTMRDWLEKHARYTVLIKTDETGNAIIKDGFVEAEHLGTGIMLIKREAFEMARPFTTCFGPPEQYRTLVPGGKFYGFFDTVEERGAYLSEDLSFCRRARLAGCEIWALVDQTVIHYGASEVSGQLLRALKMQGKTI